MKKTQRVKGGTFNRFKERKKLYVPKIVPERNIRRYIKIKITQEKKLIEIFEQERKIKQRGN